MHPMYVALKGVTLCVVIRLQLQFHPAVSFLLLLSLQFPSVQDGVFVLRKTHNSVIQPVSSFLNSALETVPILVLLVMALSHPFKCFKKNLKKKIVC